MATKFNVGDRVQFVHPSTLNSQPLYGIVVDPVEKVLEPNREMRICVHWDGGKRPVWPVASMCVVIEAAGPDLIEEMFA